MSVVDQSPDLSNRAHLDELRQNCQGVLPLDATWEGWMVDILSNHLSQLHKLVEQNGSPLNIIAARPLTRNLHELVDVAAERGLWFQPFLARKANKCLAFVEAANEVSAGIDVASEPECQQTLDLGVTGDNIICTAAIKSSTLIQLCVRRGVTIAVDNIDELSQITRIATSLDTPVDIAIRINGFHHDGSKLHSRFGFDVDEITEVTKTLSLLTSLDMTRVRGIHFHLDGYCSEQRVSAIQQCLPIVDYMRTHGHDIKFLDIGGGLPMSYLEHQSQWRQFWSTHREAMLGHHPPITYRNHGLGFARVGDQIYGERNAYPYHQSPTRATWLAKVLDAQSGEGNSIASALRDRSLQLRCEPGRSSLDGCGMTVARVEYTKQHHSGDWYIGLAMNRTQCRTGSDDFLVDPILIPQSVLPRDAKPPTANQQSIDGYLVGAYCTESELIQLRKLRFPDGIQSGDLVVFPNTAGYFMHFLESRSHQFPLAKNFVYQSSPLTPFQPDAIDALC